MAKKLASKRLRKNHKKQDIILAVLLGVVVTTIGLIVTRYSNAGSDHSFTRDPITQMKGGTVTKKTTGQQMRIAEESAPGVDPVFTLVSKTEMQNTLKVCVDYVVRKPGTWINVEYHSPSQGLAASAGTTKNSGGGTECVTTGGQAVDGTININVTPGSAQITAMYGVLRAYDD